MDAEALPLSGWCNPTRPTLPPSSRSRPHSKSIGSSPYCSHHSHKAPRAPRCPTCQSLSSTPAKGSPPTKFSRTPMKSSSQSPPLKSSSHSPAPKIAAQSPPIKASSLSPPMKPFIHSPGQESHSHPSSRASSPPTSPKFELNPTALEFCPKARKQTHNPLGGKLVSVAAMFFERAYGLNGQKRVDHETLKKEMMALTGCSERAVQAVLYGSSYSELLAPLRAQVPGYSGQKAADVQDFTKLPFYDYDGNAARSGTESTSSPKKEEISKTSSPKDLLAKDVPESQVLKHSTEVGFSSEEGVSKYYPTLLLIALVAILPLTLLY